jgi:hypothetical protein
MVARTRKHLTAWLGLTAMWLVMLLPIASQLIVAAHRDDPLNAPLCVAKQSGASHVEQSGDSLGACGYCNFLAEHVAVGAVPPLPPVVVLLVTAVATPVLSTSHTPFDGFPSGRPRDPPTFA